MPVTHVPVKNLYVPVKPNICGVVTENKNSRRICHMQKGHAGLHFDNLPMRESPEKFFGSAKAYAKYESRRK